MADQIRVLLLDDEKATVLSVDRTLERFSALVGGFIEQLRVAEDASAYINEDGKAHELAVNIVANRLLQVLGVQLWPGDVVVGPVVLFGSTSGQGERDEYEHDVPDRIVQVCQDMGIPTSTQD